MFISTLPPDMPVEEVRMYCSVEASVNMDVPAPLLFAVSMVEGGKPDTASKNRNGTSDLGYMQFNTAYLKTLARYGIKASDVQNNTCYSFHLAAWRIHQHLDEQGEDLYTKVAYYHSRTPEYNEIYARKLRSYAENFDYEKANFYLKMQTDLVNAQLQTDKENETVSSYSQSENELASASIQDTVSTLDNSVIEYDLSDLHCGVIPKAVAFDVMSKPDLFLWLSKEDGIIKAL